MHMGLGVASNSSAGRGLASHPRPKWNGFLQCNPRCGSFCEAHYQQTLFLAFLLSQSLIAALASEGFSQPPSQKHQPTMANLVAGCQDAI